jgi:hypothetical protein
MQTPQMMSFAGDHFFVGVDAHLKNWKVTIHLNGMELKTFSMNPAPLELIAYLRKHYPDGIYHDKTASTASSAILPTFRL